MGQGGRHCKEGWDREEEHCVTIKLDGIFTAHEFLTEGHTFPCRILTLKFPHSRRETDSQTKRQRQRQRQREGEKETERDKNRKTKIGTETERDRDREFELENVNTQGERQRGV